MTIRSDPAGAANLEVVTSEEGLAFWRDRARGSELDSELSGAPVVLVPTLGFRDHSGPVFPDGTAELFRYLQETLGTHQVGLAATNSEYREIALHSELLILGKFVVEYLVAPLFVTVLGGYIVNSFKDGLAEATVKASLIVDRSTPERVDVVALNYEGPAALFQETLESKLLTLPALSKEQKGLVEGGNKHAQRASKQTAKIKKSKRR